MGDDYWGEIVAAVVEVADPETFDVGELRRFAAERLAGLRRPSAYYLVGDLPKNPTGKIAKGQLRSDIVDGALGSVPSRRQKSQTAVVNSSTVLQLRLVGS
ncbi:MAG TPA: hypothetical protein PLZ93_09300 [Nocardioides sp.]|nr:hypothetical protein [uncultured Nocardioides sp.]HRD61413.1 hypothetical protein [Nocardioides sp.]HRI95797.1 hypothetical protein [Nocardioides sp.]HRK46794.1 hypothetical protein [Nocardioides sp.]